MSVAASVRSARFWPRLALGLGLAAALAAALPAVLARIVLNVTPSLPGTLYIVVPTERIARGDVVAFTPPPTRTHYRRHGRFLKIVAGLPGDLVTWQGRDVYVNGRHLGTAKPRAYDGTPLRRGPEGRIPPGRYFVWTPHPDSYDSRYADIGWIPARSIHGRAVRIL